MSLLRDALIVFLKELICFVRDRNIVINTILMPLFLYPTTFWVMNQIMLLQQGAVQQQVSKVAIVNGDQLPDLMDVLSDTDMVELVKGWAPVSSEGVDVLLDIREAHYNADNPCFKIKLDYDQANDYSIAAKKKILTVLDQFREQILLSVTLVHDIPSVVVEPFTVEIIDIASDQKMGTYFISLLLPMMIIIMAAMGTFYPAIDIIVGERERKTLETTLLSPTSRLAIVIGKFCAVVLAGIVAVFLNIVALALTAAHTLFLMAGNGSVGFSLPLKSIPLILLTTVIISACFGAACILIASYARNFREGQSFVTPFFILSFQPAIVSALPGISLTTGLAFVPVANAALMFKEIINDEYHWDKIALVLFSLVLYTGIVLIAAACRLKNENTFWREKSETLKKSFHLSQRFQFWRKP